MNYIQNPVYTSTMKNQWTCRPILKNGLNVQKKDSESSNHLVDHRLVWTSATCFNIFMLNTWILRIAFWFIEHLLSSHICDFDRKTRLIYSHSQRNCFSLTKAICFDVGIIKFKSQRVQDTWNLFFINKSNML